MMRMDDWTMASRPDAQKRLMVAPPTVSGKPAIKGAMRPMLRPCSASGKAQPIMTSSTMPGSSPGVLSMADFRMKESISSGRVSLNAPLPRLQPGVLMDVTI
jgi:hypothetical protein